MFKRFFDYYGFSKAEQRGFWALVSLIFLVLIVRVVYERWSDSPSIKHHITHFTAEDILEEEASSATQASLAPLSEHGSTRRREINYFTFDPNGLPAEKWQELGFSAKQAAAIKNYEAKGGKFYKKEDVAKLYVMSTHDYARIEPYIRIPARSDDRVADGTPSSTPEMSRVRTTDAVSIDINHADTSELKQLRGIGSVLAARAVRYREALGGFHDVAQLGEVYGIAPDVFQRIQTQLRVTNTTVLRKLNINTASAEELSRHPYIASKQARLITNYRHQHGAFHDFSDLRRIHALDEDFLRKIEPYTEW